MLHRRVNGRCRRCPVSLPHGRPRHVRRHGPRAGHDPPVGPGRGRRILHGRDRRRTGRVDGLPGVHLGPRRRHHPARHRATCDGGRQPCRSATAGGDRCRRPAGHDGCDGGLGDAARPAWHQVQLPGLVAGRLADRGHRHDRRGQPGLRLPGRAARRRPTADPTVIYHSPDQPPFYLYWAPDGRGSAS